MRISPECHAAVLRQSNSTSLVDTLIGHQNGTYEHKGCRPQPIRSPEQPSPGPRGTQNMALTIRKPCVPDHIPTEAGHAGPYRISGRVRYETGTSDDPAGQFPAQHPPTCPPGGIVCRRGQKILRQAFQAHFLIVLAPLRAGFSAFSPKCMDNALRAARESTSCFGFQEPGTRFPWSRRFPCAFPRRTDAYGLEGDRADTESLHSSDTGVSHCAIAGLLPTWQSASQRLRPSNACIRQGPGRPACSDIIQPVLREIPESNPSMNAPPVSRSSRRPKHRTEPLLQ